MLKLAALCCLLATQNAPTMTNGDLTAPAVAEGSRDCSRATPLRDIEATPDALVGGTLWLCRVSVDDVRETETVGGTAVYGFTVRDAASLRSLPSDRFEFRASASIGPRLRERAVMNREHEAMVLGRLVKGMSGYRFEASTVRWFDKNGQQVDAVD
jgi:hypothetical protein